MADEFNLDSIDEAKEAFEDLDNDASDLKMRFLEMGEAGKTAFDDISNSAVDFLGTMPAAPDAVKRLTGEFSKLKSSDIGKIFSGATDQIKKMIDVGALSEDKLLDLTGTAAAFILTSTGKIKMSDELASLSKESANATAQLGEMYDKLLPLIPGGARLKKELGALGIDLGQAFAQADSARNLETAFLRNATAAGDFGSVVRVLGNDFGLLSNKILDYTNQMRDVANANNVSFDSAVKLSNMLRKVPGVLDMVVEVGGEAGQKMNIMSAALKVASGTSQDFKDVAGDINMVLRKFNVSGTHALEVVARMAGAAEGVKMPMDLMRDYTNRAAEQFKYLGDNSQAAINVMARFGPALRKSGLGPEGIKDIVSGIVKATSEMDIAQRAFVSTQAGTGPGGLAGGYAMSLKMQQGRMDEVFSDVEKTLRNIMGGRIVTLEEAATDQGAAAQMAKQVQMLTTGPLKMADTEDQAFRIIDAFAKGGMPTLEEVKSKAGAPEEVLQKTVETGNKLQEHQLDALNIIRNEAEKQSVLAAFQLDASKKAFTGKDSTFGQDMLKEMRRSNDRAADRQVISEEPRTSLTKELRQTADTLKNIGGMAAETLGEMIPGAGPQPSQMEGAKAATQEPAPAATMRETKTVAHEPAAAPAAAVREATAIQVREDINKQPRRDIEAGAGFVNLEKEKSTETPRQRGEPSTIIIKVMSKNDVEEIIKVKLGEFGEVKGYERLAGQNGIASQK